MLTTFVRPQVYDFLLDVALHGAHYIGSGSLQLVATKCVQSKPYGWAWQTHHRDCGIVHADDISTASGSFERLN